MGPLPWLEASLPAALPLVNVVLFATTIRWLVQVAIDDRWGRWAAAVGIGCFGFFAGHDALGPDIAGDSREALGLAFGGALALLGAGLTLRHQNEGQNEGRVATVVFGFALGLVPAAGWLLAEQATFFVDVDEVSQRRAQWRRRLAPNDSRAWLALAVQARRREQNEHALAMAAIAEELAPADDRFHARILELRSAVHAAEGECDEARALFQEALEARARAAMESLDLDLSESYRMPPALAAECGWAPE